MGTGIGIIFGVSLGTTFDNIGLGISFGISLGISFGAGLGILFWSVLKKKDIEK